MKSNYAFLNDHFPALAEMGSLAEDYLYTDGNSCLAKRSLLEFNRNPRHLSVGRPVIQDGH